MLGFNDLNFGIGAVLSGSFESTAQASGLHRKVPIAPFLILFFFCLSTLIWYVDTGSRSILFIGLLFGVIAAVLTFICSHSILKTKIHTEVGFAGTVFVACLLFAAVFPPFAEPDGLHHFYASYWLADIVLGDSNIDGGSDFPVRSEDLALQPYICDRAFAPDHLYELNYDVYKVTVDGVLSDPVASGNFDRMTAYDYTLGSENMPAKIGSVAGIVLARLLNLGPFALYYVGRIGSIAFYTFLVTLAYRLMPYYKNVIVVTALLPMSLSLAASYSYDSGIIGLSLLLIAILCKGIFGDEKLSYRYCIGAAIVSMLVAPCKIVYGISILLVLFIPASKFPSKSVCYLFKLSVLILSAISVFVFRYSSINAMADVSDSLDYRGLESGHFYTLNWLIEHPGSGALLFLRTIRDMGSAYVFTMIGSNLGWLQDSIGAPLMLTVSYLIVSILVTQRGNDKEKDFSHQFRMCLAGLFAIAALGVLLPLCLDHTFDTEPVIMGVQGRYFLPILPLLLLSMRMSDVSVGRFASSWFAFNSISVLNLWYLLYILATAITL